MTLKITQNNFFRERTAKRDQNQVQKRKKQEQNE